jgi:hypothetical protein
VFPSQRSLAPSIQSNRRTPPPQSQGVKPLFTRFTNDPIVSIEVRLTGPSCICIVHRRSTTSATFPLCFFSFPDDLFWTWIPRFVASRLRLDPLMRISGDLPFPFWTIPLGGASYSHRIRRDPTRVVPACINFDDYDY